MTEQRDSVVVEPGATCVMPFPEIETRLLAERDKHAEITRLALRVDPPDYTIVNEHDALARLYFEAAETIRRLKEQSVIMKASLAMRRVKA